MGNSVCDGQASTNQGCGTITTFYSPSAWIEDQAEQQLKQLSGWAGVREIAAFPDLHPGKYGPVGCAVLADRLYPQLIGSDIGCGMALFALGLPARKFKLDKAERRMRALEGPLDADLSERLEEAGLPPDQFAQALGTIGGGNHFCEVQNLVEAEPDSGLDISRLYLLVHSGSRGFGNAVLGALPQGAFAGLLPDDPVAQSYLRDHDQAVTWARLNRQIIAERAAEALRADLHLISDAPHNLLEQKGTGWLHRKGAAKAEGGLIPLAGTRATPSYLLRPLGHADALGSLAHGAGRRYDRSSMHGRVRGKRSDLEAMTRTQFGGRILCEDRDLLIEEAPLAYKSAGDVAADLRDMAVAQTVAKFHPLLSFKKVKSEGRR